MASALSEPYTMGELDSLISYETKDKVFWEESNVSADDSIMKYLILPSNTTAISISRITYQISGPQGKLITGGSIFTPASSHIPARWQLENRITKPNKVARTIHGAVAGTRRSSRIMGKRRALNSQMPITESEGEHYEDVDAEYFSFGAGTVDSANESSYNDQDYREKNTNNKWARSELIPEAKWARLFNTTQDYMHTTYKEAHRAPLPAFPFNPAKLHINGLLKRKRSAQFANSSVPNNTTAQKPGIVLVKYDLLAYSEHPKYRDMKFKLTWTHFLTCIEFTDSELTPRGDVPIYKGLVTKGYLMMQKQP